MGIKQQMVLGINRVILITKKYSPEILTAVGVAAGIGATATAVNSTLHCDSILDTHKANMNKIEMAKKAVEKDDTLTYPVEKQRSDKTVVYTKSAISFARLYMPTVILTGLSITCILSAHNIMSKRNAALSAAFAAVSNKFMDYRAHVRDEYGAEKDHEFYNEIVTEEVKDEKGKVVEKKKTVDNHMANFSQAFFDEFSPFWCKDNPELNVAHLEAVASQANDYLYAHGYLFLSDIYDWLGITQTPASRVVGWLYDANHQDTYVDFGVIDDSGQAWDSVNDCAWDGKMGIKLNFNLDGSSVIYDHI